MNKIYIDEIPELIDEWDWENNSINNIYPDKLSHGSTKKVHWICKKGHSFVARVDHRTIMKSGCPYCSGKKPIIGENDINSTHPELCKEWDYEKNIDLNPEDYIAGSNKKVYWKCNKCGHSWLAAISARTIKGTNCPVCAKQKRTQTKAEKLVADKGSLLETHPELCEEWDCKLNGELTPDKVTAGSHKIVYWRGKNCRHSWKSSIVNRVNGNNCPICSGKKIQIGFNDLATTNPSVAEEWHPTLNESLTPNQVSRGSERKVWWLCPKCGQAYNTSIYSRAMLNTNCPVCANRTVMQGINDLKTTHPHLLEEWDYEKNDVLPTDLVAGSYKSIWWKCKANHSWKTSVNDRLRGRGCPICARKMRPVNRQKTYLMKNGSLIDNYPIIAKQWHPTKNEGIDPKKITSGSSQSVWWICEKGHEWKAVISSRIAGRGCPVCARELFTSYPEQILFFYFSKVCETINRFKIDGREVDIFLPKYNIGIEYNGQYYHHNRKEKDKEKYEYLTNKGIRVFVINEADESNFAGDLIYYKPDKDYKSLEDVIKYLMDKIKIEIPDIDIKNDSIKIQELYVSLEKKNSIGTKYPWLIEEWDYEMNGKLSPFHVSYGSNKKIHWICNKCGHRWSANANSRKKSGCPCCAKKVLVTGKNDVATTHPHIVADWDYEKNDISPTKVSYGSKESVWWKCRNGHTQKTSIQNRCKNNGCKLCNKNENDSKNNTLKE